jgi:hypothetical protein
MDEQKITHTSPNVKENASIEFLAVYDYDWSWIPKNRWPEIQNVKRPLVSKGYHG